MQFQSKLLLIFCIVERFSLGLAAMKILVIPLLLVLISAHVGKCQNFIRRDLDSAEDLFDDSREITFSRPSARSFRNSRESRESRENFRSFNSIRSRNNFDDSRERFGSVRSFQDSRESREVFVNSPRSQNTLRSRSRFDDSVESRENFGSSFRTFSSPRVTRPQIQNTLRGLSRFGNSLESDEIIRGTGFRSTSLPANTRFGNRRFSNSIESRENRFGSTGFRSRPFSTPNTNTFPPTRRFRDSIESNEVRSNFNTRPTTRNFGSNNFFNNRLDDSIESRERTVGLNRRFPTARINNNRFGDSRESNERVVIVPPTTRRTFNRFNRIGLQNQFGRRDSIEDSFEIRRTPTFRNNAFNQRTRTSFPQRFGGAGLSRNTLTRDFDDSIENHFGRNTFRTGTNKLGRIDTSNELLDDLFDDDLDDRIRAQNALNQINRNQVIDHFSTAQHSRPASNRFTGSTRGFGTASSGRPLPPTPPKTQVVSSRPGSFRFSTPIGQSRPVSRPVSKPSSAFSFNNRVGSNKITKTPPKTKIQPSVFNRISSSPFSSAKNSGVTGFKWPENGVSGYYVSMSTNNSPATSYFVQLDD